MSLITGDPYNLPVKIIGLNEPFRISKSANSSELFSFGKIDFAPFMINEVMKEKNKEQNLLKDMTWNIEFAEENTHVNQILWGKYKWTKC